jgi:hypothetical protein
MTVLTHYEEQSLTSYTKKVLIILITQKPQNLKPQVPSQGISNVFGDA